MPDPGPVRARCAVAGLAGALVAGALGLAGCGGGGAGSIAEREVTFPVLWAGTNADGTPAAGIEPATIAVGTEGAAGFTVDLEDLQAKKAGPAWMAATASAAAVGTLLTGADQSVVNLRYGITGAIDGPSGGAALAVGTMAAITGAPVRKGVAMTGTVAPDGTVGTVAQVPAKVRAARKAGYRTVLVPEGNVAEFDPAAGKVVNLPALGRSLGIEVRVVRDVGAAYRVFTGRTVFSPPTSPPRLTPAAQQAAVRTTRAAVRAVRSELDAGGNLITAARAPALEAMVRRAEGALAAGRTARAYGLAVQAAYQVKRATARGASRALAAARGPAAARTALGDEVSTLLTVARREIEARSDPAGLDLGQHLALPLALGWYSYSIATLQALEKGLGPGSTWGPAQVQSAAAVVGDVEVALQRLGPDAVAMVRASPGSATADDARTAEFLSGYTTFLVGAGDAARAYYETVVGGSVAAANAPTDLAPVLGQMATLADATPPGQNPLAEEIAQAANASTYEVLGAAVLSAGNYGLDNFGVGQDPGTVTSPRLLANAITQASATVEWVAAGLEGINPGYALWQRQWADALVAATAGTPHAAGAATIALNELWSGALGMLLANSAQTNLGAAGG